MKECVGTNETTTIASIFAVGFQLISPSPKPRN